MTLWEHIYNVNGRFISLLLAELEYISHSLKWSISSLNTLKLRFQYIISGSKSWGKYRPSFSSPFSFSRSTPKRILFLSPTNCHLLPSSNPPNSSSLCRNWPEIHTFKTLKILDLSFPPNYSSQGTKSMRPISTTKVLTRIVLMMKLSARYTQLLWVLEGYPSCLKTTLLSKLSCSPEKNKGMAQSKSKVLRHSNTI